MADGVTVSISELIELKQMALSAKAMPAEARARSPGSYQSRLRGRGMEFSEIRNYQAGDEIRHMEWRVTARTGRPHVKLYHEERERPVLLVTDFNPSMYFGTRIAFKSVLAAKLTALLAWRAIHQGDKVGGLMFSKEHHHEFPPHSRHAHVMKILGCLAHYTTLLPAPHQPKHTPLSHILRAVRSVNKPGSLIIFISDFYSLDEDSEQHLVHLRQHNDLIALHLYDPVELVLPPSGLYPVTNSQDTLMLDADEPHTASTYEEYWIKRNLALKQRCQRLGIHYTRLSAEHDLSHVLSHAFPRRNHGSR